MIGMNCSPFTIVYLQMLPMIFFFKSTITQSLAGNIYLYTSSKIITLVKNQTTHRVQAEHFLKKIIFSTPAFSRYKTTLWIHCTKYVVCHKMYFIIKHCTNNTCSHSSKLRSSRTSSCLPLTPRHSSIYPSLVISSSPSLSIVCCVYLPACWLCVQMAVGINVWRYCVVLLWGILNLLLLCVCCQIQESVFSSAKTVPQFVCC